MARLVVQVAGVETAPPAGWVFGAYRYTLHPKGQPMSPPLQTLVSADLFAEFAADVEPGEYTVAVAALSVDGQENGAPATGDVTVGSAGVPQTYLHPTGLSFVVL